ncbi:LysR family transcriptional regulator [Photobacterium sp. J15]|uniref:LysR family transcriptional regulator n=1 Tax=Photobacterium sp. J15 TaxID=265901 RepID=UPI000A0235A8|nr:LysR family transcriptional regulator [Photobacterium sp. J15]
MLDTYNELLTFAFICKTLSITETAQELKKSKAHVSRQLANLEKRIGTTLVYRTTRSLTLTENGLALKSDAISLLNASQQLDYKASSLSSGISGRFCITIPTSIATSIFSEVLSGLNKQFPKVSFEIVVSNNVEPLLDKKIDLGIRIGAVDEKLVAHKVGSYRTVFVSSNKEDKNRQINELTLVVNSFPCTPSFNLKVENELLNVNSFKDTIFVNETATQLSFIKNGLGVGLIPSYILSATMHDKLFQILPEHRGKEVDLYITYPYQTPLPEKLSKISAYLKDELKKYLNQ